MKRIFIAHILPRKDVLQNHLSVAGCNFCWNLIEGGVFDKVYSVLPPFINGNKNLIVLVWFILIGDIPMA